MTPEERIESRDRSRCRADNRAYDRICKAHDDADALVGEFSHGELYINVRSKTGKLTGAIRRFVHKSDAIDYLIRNRYV